MSVQTGERAFHKLQMGVESVEGTATTGRFLFPAESSSQADLNRAPSMPNEDYGELAGVHAGRSVFGVRESSFTLRALARFEDIMSILEMCVAGGITPSGPVSGLYTWLYPFDNTSDTLKSRTIQDGDNINVWAVAGCLGTRLRMSWTALKPGTASPVELELTVVGRDKNIINGFTGSPSVQTAPETMMGHLARLYYGTTGTTFANLSQLVKSLVSFDITIETGVLLRKQGGTDDKADAHGRGKIGVTFTMVVESKAAEEAAFWAVFESDAANPAIPTKRMRIQILGSPLGGTNEVQTITITGTPAGGYFTVSFGGQTSGHIAYNATAADVQSALQAMTSIGLGGVIVTGGPGPGTPYVVTFHEGLGYTDLPMMTTTDAFTGGSSPASAVTETTPGVSSAAKSFTIDASVQMTAVPVQESDGATRFAIAGQFVKDATLASIGQFTVVNAISAIPDA